MMQADFGFREQCETRSTGALTLKIPAINKGFFTVIKTLVSPT
jgi:hypothetical protein